MFVATTSCLKEIVPSNHSVQEENKKNLLNMETILGIKGQDFVMVAADCTQANSIITLKEGKKK